MPSEFKPENWLLENLYRFQPDGHPQFVVITYPIWQAERNEFCKYFDSNTESNICYIFDRDNAFVVIDRRLFCHKTPQEYAFDRDFRSYWLYANCGNRAGTDPFSYIGGVGRYDDEYVDIVRTLHATIHERNDNIGTIWYIMPKCGYEEIFPRQYAGKVALPEGTPTLLRVLSHLKRQNKETYFKNASNDAHKWLKAHYSKALGTRKITKGETQIQRFLRVISKRLGYPIIYLDQGLKAARSVRFVPQSLCNKVHHNNQRSVWVEHEEWIEWKKAGKIQWCSLNNDWFVSQAFSHYYRQYGQRILKHYHAISVNHLDICLECKHNWFKSNLKPHPQTDNLTCPTCLQKPSQYQNQPLHGRAIWEYHSHRGVWQFLIQREKGEEAELPIGVEIEVQSLDPLGTTPPPNRRDTLIRGNWDLTAEQAAWHIYNTQKEINPDWNNLYFEWDGSLSAGGFEIISNPMTAAFHRRYWEAMMPEIRKVATGWYTKGKKELPEGDTSTYGIHLTFHTRYWKDLWLVRLAKFCAYQGNKDFIHAIAQRTILYGGGDFLGKMNDPKVKAMFQIQAKKLASSARSNVYLKRPLVEVRMFRSTLNTTSFLKNIEWLTAFWKWCQSTPFDITYQAFMAWLVMQPQHEKQYPYLMEYLSRNKFSVKNREVFTNPFKQFLKKKYITGQGKLFPNTYPKGKELALEDEGDII